VPAPAAAPFVSAIVLAAGESTRMGRQKALVEWHGVPLIEYQLRQLDSIDAIREIVVVTGHQPEAITAILCGFASARVAQNDGYASGKVSSILTGLAAVSQHAEAVVLIAVDQPRSRDVVARLIKRHMEVEAAITVPVQARRRGHPVIFARRLLPELAGITEESQGIRAVLDRHNADVLEVEFDDPGIHLDLNRPEDLRSAGA
jgi:molybdenum cofactor cytidylyltransferase